MNNKAQKIFIRVMCVVLAVLMAASVLISILASTAGAVTQDEIDKLQKDLDGLRQQQKDLKSEINSAKYEKSQLTEKKKLLDQRIEVTMDVIANYDAQIEQYGILITEKEEEVAQRKADEEAQWEQYKVRIRAMEENGTVSYYAIIFGARDFSDLLTRIDMISSIMDYDESLYQRYVSAREATESAKATLESVQADMEVKRQEQQEAKDQLEVEQQEAIDLINALQDDITQMQAVYDAKAADEDALKAEITKLQKELEASRRVKGTGQFQWPVDSNVVTSGFGGRNTGIAGASTNHKGVDLKALTGANIYASDTGTVITSAYSSSYGNYIVIDHGNGYCSLYGHMSKRLVSKGDTVQKGQKIGLSGATGIVNGPHLHFEIWKNGVKINPLQFFDSSTYIVR